MSGVGCDFCLWLFVDFSVYLFGCGLWLWHSLDFSVTIFLSWINTGPIDYHYLLRPLLLYLLLPAAATVCDCICMHLIIRQLPIYDTRQNHKNMGYRWLEPAAPVVSTYENATNTWYILLEDPGTNTLLSLVCRMYRNIYIGNHRKAGKHTRTRSIAW